MIETYHIVGGNAAFNGIFFPAVVAAGLLILFVVRLVRQKCSPGFVVSFIAVFCTVVLLELSFFYAAAQYRSDAWFDAFTKTAASCANASHGFNYWKIKIGNEKLFSEWSPSAVPQKTQRLTPLQETQTPYIPVPAAQSEGRFTVPANLTVFQGPESLQTDTPVQQSRRNEWGVAELTDNNEAFSKAKGQLTVRWDSVAGATTYRLQWKDAEKDKAEWIDVYSGSRSGCVLQIPQTSSVELRVRAENGTAEDDPLFLQLAAIYDAPTAANPMLCSVYALRYTEGIGWRYLVSPISDANYNGRIDIDEKPRAVGEIDSEPSPVFDYVLKEHIPGAGTLAGSGQRNNRLSVAVPLWNLDGSFDGLVVLDFHADRLREHLHRGNTVAFIGFFLTLAFLFGAGFLFVERQQKTEELQKNNESLEFTVIELQESLLAAQKNRQTQTSLLTQMSCEIRTQLTSVLGFAHLTGRRLMQRCKDTERDESKLWINSITNESKSLLTLITRFLDYTSVDGKQKDLVDIVPVNLKELILNVTEVMRPRLENKPVVFSVIEHGAVPQFILSDPVQIRQVLVNLIGNAIKFTQQGEVRLEYGTEQASAFWNSLSALESGQAADVIKDLMFFTVSDTGIGIPSGEMGNIFLSWSPTDSPQTDLPQNRRYGGTGMGLSVSKRYAETLGGSLSVTSEPGQGSTFTFLLPVWVADTESALLDLASQKSLGRGKPKVVSITKTKPSKCLHKTRILIVEDGRINQMILTAQLTGEGAEVIIAENGQLGIDAATAGIRKKPFDIILMDIAMPVMDGYDAVKHLRSTGYTKPIIAVTGHTSESDKEKILSSGFDAFVPKPVDRKLLIDTIKSFLPPTP
ncbi:MAG: response regulator [Planctomycetaceae bacterium]|jgi:signal transduction histidine kinase|nr:response regulator [Planctomycetaceae bacterium]